MADMRLTLRQAAAALGVSESAIRKRVERGTLPSDKGPDGRRYVYLDTMADSVTDEGADATTTPEPGALISELRAHNDTLREQLEAERHAHAEARRIIAGLVERIPAIEAPQEARESPQTVEEEPEEAEPHSATVGVREGTEVPQQRSGWLGPVDKLPWWHYVLGLFLVSMATFVSFFAWQTMSMFGLNVVIGNVVANVVLVWFPPAVFGFWVGLRRMDPRFKSQVIPFGLLIGLSVSIGRGGQLIAVGTDYFRGGSDISYWSGYFVAPALTGWLFYVSGVLVGNARQRRRTRRLSSTTISSSPEPTTGWTPRQQAILGFAGTVIAALISLMGAIGSALVASGG
jgi:hypothetical protein